MEFTDEEISPVAHSIAQIKKAAGDKYWNDSLSNWFEAKNKLEQQKRFDEEHYATGECGQ